MYVVLLVCLVRLASLVTICVSGRKKLKQAVKNLRRFHQLSRKKLLNLRSFVVHF